MVRRIRPSTEEGVFTKLRVKNFRALEDVECGGLKRINIFTGRNGAGKSSLLEAILLLAAGANPRASVDRSTFRNRHRADRVFPEVHETVWRQIFRGLDTSLTVRVEADHSTRGNPAIELSMCGDSSYHGTVSSVERTSATRSSRNDALSVHYSGDSKLTDRRYSAWIEDGTVKWNTKVKPAFPFDVTLVDERYVDDRTADNFSQISTKQQREDIIEGIRIVAPKVEDIRIRMVGGEPAVWVDGGLPEHVPLSSMGEGALQMLRLAMALAQRDESVTLADEIERGIHHTALDKVWEMAEKMTDKFDNQLFATTHSFECVQAAYRVLGPDGFSLHRMWARNGKVRCVPFDSEMISFAMKHPTEVR